MGTPYLGEIRMVGFGFAPKGWAPCNGQTMQISQYQALFSLLGTTFGGDGRSTFLLPDFRGRTAIEPGVLPNNPTYVWGQKGGEEAHTLIVAEMAYRDSGVPGVRLPAIMNDRTESCDAHDRRVSQTLLFFQAIDVGLYLRRQRAQARRRRDREC